MTQPPCFEVRLSIPAARDVAAILKWSEEEFGQAAARRYEALIVQALTDIGSNPALPGSKERPDLIDGARTYHLCYSRKRVNGVQVKAPRHFLLYRHTVEGVVEIGRILHDSRDLPRHLPDGYQRGFS